MGNCGGPGSSSSSQPNQLFQRRRKIVMECKWKEGPHSEFVIFDPFKEEVEKGVPWARGVTASRTDEKSLTVISFNEWKGDIEVLDMGTGRPKRPGYGGIWENRHFTLVGDFVCYQHPDSFIRVRRSLSGYAELLLPGLVKDTTEVGGKLATLQSSQVNISATVVGFRRSYPSHDLNVGIIKLFDIESMSCMKTIEILSFGYEETVEVMRKVNDKTLLLVSSLGRFTLLDITTGKYKHYQHSLRFCPRKISVFPDSDFRDPFIFVVRYREVEVIEFKETEVYDVHVTRMVSIEDIVAVERDQVFCLDQKGNFELWKVSRANGREGVGRAWGGKELLRKGSIGERVFSPRLVSLSSGERREETLCFVSHLEICVSSVPSALLEVIAGFI